MLQQHTTSSGLKNTYSFLFSQVWISFAQFELSVGLDTSIEKCRKVYEEACKAMRDNEKEERLMILESWQEFEVS